MQCFYEKRSFYVIILQNNYKGLSVNSKINTLGEKIDNLIYKICEIIL